jgi:hypothetical protein
MNYGEKKFLPYIWVNMTEDTRERVGTTVSFHTKAEILQ